MLHIVCAMAYHIAIPLCGIEVNAVLYVVCCIAIPLCGIEVNGALYYM